jgi:hypothetical protein
MEDQDRTNPQKLLHKYRRQPWWVLLLITIVPPVGTGFMSAYFSYRASTLETRVKAAETKRTAEKGYEELVKAVDQLQKHDEETGRTIAELNGHIKSIEAWMVGMRPHTDTRTRETHLDLPVPRGAPDQTHWRPNFPPPVVSPKASSQKLDLPRSLDEAAKK